MYTVRCWEIIGCSFLGCAHYKDQGLILEIIADYCDDHTKYNMNCPDNNTKNLTVWYIWLPLHSTGFNP